MAVKICLVLERPATVIDGAAEHFLWHVVVQIIDERPELLDLW